MSNESKGKTDLGNKPIIVAIGVIAALVTIFIFVTGRQTLPEVISNVVPASLPNEAEQALERWIRGTLASVEDYTYTIVRSQRATNPNPRATFTRNDEVWCVVVSPPMRWEGTLLNSVLERYLIMRTGLTWQAGQVVDAGDDGMDIREFGLYGCNI